MEKLKAQESINNCFNYFDKIDVQEFCKAIIMDDKDKLAKMKGKYQSIMAKKQAYIDQIEQAKDDAEIMKIVGSVNLSDVV